VNSIGQLQDSTTLFVGNGDGTFESPITVQTNVGSSGLAVGDLNGDGKPDLITGPVVAPDGTNVFQVLLGNGDGTFRTGPEVPASGQTGLLGGKPVLADINGDGKLDLITYSSGSNGADDILDIFLGNGDGTFGAPTAVDLGGQAANGQQPFLASDVFGLGRTDLVSIVHNPDGSFVGISILKNLGNGTFAAPQLIPLPGGTQPSPTLAVADLNGDGHPDLVATDADGAAVFLGRADGTFADPIQLTDPPNSFIVTVAVADADGDGHPDVITSDLLEGSNPVTGLISVFRGRGDGTFFPDRVDVSTHFVSSQLLVGDLDGSGHLGLISLNESADPLNTGTGLSLSVYRLGSGGSGGGAAPVGPVTYTYDPKFNKITSYTDELGHKTLYDIDPATGNVLSVTRVGGGGVPDEVTLYSYTPQGLIASQTDPLGHVTTYAYDSQGRLITLTQAKGTPDESVRHYEYDAAGNLTATTDELGNRTVYIYDGYNRLIRQTGPDPDGAGPLQAPVTSYAYDSAGNETSITDPTGKVTRFGYDFAGRLIKVIDPAGNVTSYTYDASGNQISSTDPNGNTVHNQFDARGRLIETIFPDGSTVQARYNAKNQITALIDPNGNETQYRYDSRGRKIRETDPLGKSTMFSYDAADNLNSTTDRDGRTITYQYDALGRVISEAWVGTPEVIHYAYNADDELLSATDSASGVTITYDARGRVATADNAGTPGAPHVVLAYAYDAANNPISTSETINGTAGATTTYSFDALDRPTRIDQQGSGVQAKRVDLSCNGLNQFTSIARYSDLAGTQQVATTTYQYDSANRTSGLTTVGSGGTVLDSIQYSYDAGSRLTGLTDASGTTTYSYDTRNQLTGAHSTSGAVPDASYTYDPAGNRLTTAAQTLPSQIGAGNRLLSDGTNNYTYDNDGNLIREVQIATGATREFTWDYRNRLTSVTDLDASGAVQQVVKYTYDAANRRISESVTSGAAGANSHNSFFIYDGTDEILEFDSTGQAAPTLAERYLYGPAIDQVLAQEDASGNVLWYLADALNTVRGLVNDAGQLVDRLTYDPFGNVTGQTDPSRSPRFQFVGREFDSATGLIYYRARYLDVSAGRFVSEDPLGVLGDGTNLYRYVRNAPTFRTDPTGLWSFTVAFVPFGFGLSLTLGKDTNGGFIDFTGGVGAGSGVTINPKGTSNAKFACGFYLGVGATAGVTPGIANLEVSPRAAIEFGKTGGVPDVGLDLSLNPSASFLRGALGVRASGVAGVTTGISGIGKNGACACDNPPSL
jgi:RHS repeat-associated protein